MSAKTPARSVHRGINPDARFRHCTPPATTAHGALLAHITGGHIETTDARGSSFQPMNVNFGLFPPIEKVKTRDGKRLKHAEQAVERKRAYCLRAMADFSAWIGSAEVKAAE